MLTMLFHSQDAAQATRLRQQLQDAGYMFGETATTRTDSVIALFSQAALQDVTFQTRLNTALDRGQAIIPVLAEPVALPSSIEHLTPIDLHDADMLNLQIDAAAGARISLKVLTPAAKRSNTRIGLVIAALALGMFIIGVYAVALLDIEAPIEEFNAIDTQAAATRDILIASTLESYLPYLPGSLEEAAFYAVTVQAVPTRIRPFVAGTATAVAIDQQN